MIAKVLWQAWLNWCVSKFIYSTSVEQHLWCVLWNWKRSLLESQPRKCCSPCWIQTPNFGQSGLSKSCKSPHLHKALCMVYVFMSAAATGDSRRPGWEALRCSGCPLVSSEGCETGETLTGVREKAPAPGIGAWCISEQDLALDVWGFRGTSAASPLLFSQI